ncbi:MAG: PIG-L family deacetylase [Thermoproteota archaeon]|jgi:glucosamine-6-phosphate deaminase
MRIKRELIKRIIVAEDEEQMGEIAARAIMEDIEKFIKKKGKVVMLFASAPSQHSTWKAMRKLVKRKTIMGTFDPSKIIAFHMDEYLGLDPEAPQLFGKVLKNMLFQPLGLKEENIHYFDSRVGYNIAKRLREAISKNEPKEIVEELSRKLEEEAEKHAKEIEKEFLKAGGVFDIVVGGIGKHPHIAFNDAPYAKFNDPKIIKVVRLSETSRQQQVDDKEFSRIEDVPTHALTFTLPPIFKAKKIHIVVPRALKAEAVRQTLDGPITEQVPASGLKLPRVLRKVRFYLDKDSASLSKIAQEVVRIKGYAKIRELKIPEKISLLYRKEIPVEGIPIVNLPINQRTAVIDYEAKAYIGQFIEELKRENDVKYFKLRDVKKIFQFSPDLVIVPYLDETSKEYKRIEQVTQKLVNTGIRLVYYFPKVEKANVYFFFEEDLMKLKNKAINAHKSQISRVRFDLAIKNINKANALYGKIFKIGKGSYAETFEKFFIENGEIKHIKKKSILSKENISKRTTAIVVSPHPDDMEIACGASIAFLKSIGAYVANLVYTSGHYASMPEIDNLNITQEEKKKRKIEVRRNEVAQAAKILNIDDYKCLCLDFYESEGGDKISTRDWNEVENLFRDYLKRNTQEKRNFIVFVPDPNDLHPNHRASTSLTLEVLRKLTKEQKEKVAVFLYESEWTGKVNLLYYFPKIKARKVKEIAAKYEAIALAISGAEILKGFAKKPPLPEELGGKYAIKLYAK